MRRNITIIDDDPALSGIWKALLEKNGYHVKILNDSEMALSAIAEDKTDLMLVDVLMPRLDGIGFSQKVRERYSKEDVPIILMSGVYKKHDLNSHTKHLVNDFIEKPFHLETLLTKIKSLLPEKEETQPLQTPGKDFDVELELSPSMHFPVPDTLPEEPNTIEIEAELEGEPDMESQLDIDALFPEDDEDLIQAAEESFPKANADDLPDLEAGYASFGSDVSLDADFSRDVLPPAPRDPRERSRSWTDEAITSELNKLLSSIKKPV